MIGELTQTSVGIAVKRTDNKFYPFFVSNWTYQLTILYCFREATSYVIATPNSVTMNLANMINDSERVFGTNKVKGDSGSMTEDEGKAIKYSQFTATNHFTCYLNESVTTGTYKHASCLVDVKSTFLMFSSTRLPGLGARCWVRTRFAINHISGGIIGDPWSVSKFCLLG